MKAKAVSTSILAALAVFFTAAHFWRDASVVTLKEDATALDVKEEIKRLGQENGRLKQRLESLEGVVAARGSGKSHVEPDQAEAAVAVTAPAAADTPRATARTSNTKIDEFETEMRALTSDIEKYAPSQLMSCVAWAKGSSSDLLANIKKQDGNSCPIKTQRTRGRAALGDDGETVSTAKDALMMCQIIGRLMELGRLPATLSEIRDSGLIALDVGAAFGTELLVFNMIGFNTYSFEARKSEFDLLVKEWRERLAPTAHIIQAAVSDVKGGIGTLEIYNAKDSSSLHKQAVSSGPEKKKVNNEVAKGHDVVETVPAMSLDYALKDATYPVGFVKIDVQGHEYEVLMGAYGILKTDKPALFFEYSPKFRGPEAPRILCFVKSLGYDCSFYSGDNMICTHPEAKHYKPSRR